MSRHIEEYALLADGRCAALLSRDGTIDWLSWPRFGSEPRFAALVATPQSGHGHVGPAGPAHNISRRDEADTLVVRTDFEWDGGHTRLTDFMAVNASEPCIIRIVEGVHGCVAMRTVPQPREDRNAPAPAVVQARRVGTFRAARHVAPLAAMDRPLRRQPYALAASRVPLAVNALIYLPSGAMVGTPTTSLTEVTGGSLTASRLFQTPGTGLQGACNVSGPATEKNRPEGWHLRCSSG